MTGSGKNGKSPCGNGLVGNAGGRVWSVRLGHSRPRGALTFKRISGFSLGATEASGRALREGPSVGPSERRHFEGLSDTWGKGRDPGEAWRCWEAVVSA